MLPSEAGAYKQEEKLKCLDRVIFSVRFLSKGNLSGRNCIDNLIKRFAKFEDLSRQNKIIPVP